MSHIQPPKSPISRCVSPSKSQNNQSVFISYDESNLSTVEKVKKFRSHLTRTGKTVHEHAVSL